MENDNNYSNSYKYKSCCDLLNSYSGKSTYKHEPYNILVIGAGYVGLSISLLLSINNKVDVVDINIDKVNKINNRDLDKDINKYKSNKKINLKAYLPDNLYINKDFIIISIPANYDGNTKLLGTDDVNK